MVYRCVLNNRNIEIGLFVRSNKNLWLPFFHQLLPTLPKVAPGGEVSVNFIEFNLNHSICNGRALPKVTPGGEVSVNLIEFNLI